MSDIKILKASWSTSPNFGWWWWKASDEFVGAIRQQWMHISWQCWVVWQSLHCHPNAVDEKVVRVLRNVQLENNFTNLITLCLTLCYFAVKQVVIEIARFLALADGWLTNMNKFDSVGAYLITSSSPRYSL